MFSWPMVVRDFERGLVGAWEGVGDQQRPNYSKNCPPVVFSYSEGGRGKKGVLLLRRGHRKKGGMGGFPYVPTPSVRQPLFETSDLVAPIALILRYSAGH